MKNIVTILLLLILSIACGGGSSTDSQSGISFRFKPSNFYSANPDDKITIREKQTNIIIWEDTLRNQPVVTVSLGDIKAFYIEVKRNGKDFVSTFVSKRQIEKSLYGNLIIDVGDLNAITTLMVHIGEDRLKEYFEGVEDFSDLRYRNVLSDFVVRKEAFYELADKANALSLYYQIITTENVDPSLNTLYKTLIESNDPNEWKSKAYSLELPDAENGGINLTSSLLETNKFITSTTHNLLKPNELRKVFWDVAVSDNILDYVGRNIIINDGHLDLTSGATITDLNVSGNLFLNGELWEPELPDTISTITQEYYTVDNTITNQYYTLDNTITQNITQLTNTFLLTDFDTVTGNSLVVGNIILDGNLLLPTVTNNYYTLDNTITNVDNTITNQYYTLDNTITQNITQLTNTFLLTDFDTISGNSIISGNLFLSDNIYINGNLLHPTVTNYYTVGNTTNVSNTFITQLTNTFLLSDFDTISGNSITLADNLTSTNLFLSGNIYLDGNLLDYSITNVTQLTNTFTLNSFDNVSGNSITVDGDITSANIITNNGNIINDLWVNGNVFAGNIIPMDDMMYDLGKNGRVWREMWTVDLMLASDRRYKKDIEPITNSTNILMSLRPVQYRMIHNNEKKIGLIAQEVEEVLPDAVSRGNMMGVDYIQMIPLLIKTIQEQQEDIELLKRRLYDNR